MYLNSIMYWVFGFVLTFVLFPNEYRAYTYQSPEYRDLETTVGTFKVKRTNVRPPALLVLVKPDQSERVLFCHIWFENLSICPPKGMMRNEKIEFYRDNQFVVAYNSKRGTIYELSINGENCSTMNSKKKNINHKRHHSYLLGHFSRLAFGGRLLLQLYEERSQRKI